MAQNPNLRGQAGHQPIILALDVGTSSTRALLFDAGGAAVRGVQSQHSYQLTFSSEGEVAVDPDMLVEKGAQTIDEALHMAGPLADSIGAVAIDTFWHSLMGVDANNKALTPLNTWEDTRPRHAADELQGQLDNEEIHPRTGARVQTGYWTANLR